ncbi:hypothetical protein EAF00_004899 [Botryotinia globosa]|nr:hypothetical protein EAF00_004899 [Botryotinia globosa]
MSSRNYRRSQVGQGSSSRSSRPSAVQESTAQPIETLNTHRVNTLTELCRIERIAAASNEEELLSNDLNSNRSWNYAWLVLIKIHDDGMIQKHAQSEATKPEMWGGRYPEAEEAGQLAACFAYEWQEALDRMLRHWETLPTNSGY